MHKLILIAASIALATPALAQTPAPAQDYTVKLPAAQWDIIGTALGKMTYTDAAPVIAVIREQIIEQQKPKAEPAKKE